MVRNRWDDFDFGNTTPVVGATPDSIEPPDPAHIKALLAGRRVVIACGRQAGDIITPMWKGPLLVTPHPAHRVVTNRLFEECQLWIFNDPRSRMRVVQERGFPDWRKIE